MSKWMISEREHALEEMFFKKKEAELLAKLRQQEEGKRIKEKLAEVSGISDEDVLGHLVDMGIRPETFAAISLIPLIEVAWSDKTMEPEESEAIMKGAVASGIKAGTSAYKLLENWLHDRPQEKLYAAWSEYIMALSGKMGREEFNDLKGVVIGRAIEVAEAAGGLLGKNSISSAEQAVINKLNKLFDQAPASSKGK